MSLDVYLYETEDEDREDVFWRNITHNLTRMANAAGLYEALWRPEEINATKASQLIEPLQEGLARLVAEPAKYKEMNPSNGWGSYDGLLNFALSYLEACQTYPDAFIHVSR